MTLKFDILNAIHINISKLIKLDTSICHCDLTNFYVYTDNSNNSILKRGYSKEHSQHPIVQMALLTDRNGIPINYKLYPGNTPDVSTIASQSIKLNIGKSIIVGDAGIVSQNNILSTLMSRNGYIFKKSLFKLSKDEKEMFLKTIKSNIEKAISLTDSDSFYISCNINVDREVTDIYGVRKKS